MSTPELSNWYGLLSGTWPDPIVLPPEDHVGQLGLDFDVRGHHEAIGRLIDRNRKDEEEVAAQIRNGVGDRFNDLAYDMRFQGMAHSMSAVGLLAPFLEAILYQGFQGVGRVWPEAERLKSKHIRWRLAKVEKWSCRYYYDADPKQMKGRLGLVQGVNQLLEATGFALRFAPDFGLMFAALTDYRNQMLHNGFEWAKPKRAEFITRLEKEGWHADWFDMGTDGKDPWLFHMSDKFIDLVLDITWKVVSVFGTFARDELPGLKAAANTPTD